MIENELLLLYSFYFYANFDVRAQIQKYEQLDLKMLKEPGSRTLFIRFEMGQRAYANVYKGSRYKNKKKKIYAKKLGIGEGRDRNKFSQISTWLLAPTI